MASSTAQPLHLHCRSRPPPSDQQTMVSSSAPPLHLHCRSVPHRWTSYNGKQHSATSSPALQVGPAPLDQFPKGCLPGQPQAVCQPCGELLPSLPPSQLHRTGVRGSSLPAGPPQQGRPQDLATSSSSSITDAVAEGGLVETGIICT
jgi:hypothetical protein